MSNLFIMMWQIIMPTRVVSLPQVKTMQQDEYILAVCVALTALLISFVVSYLIPYQGGNDKSYVKRRIFHIVLGVLTVISFWYTYYALVIPKVANPAFRNMLEQTNNYCIFVTAGVYAIVGLIIMFCFRRSKFGSILGKVKE